MDYFVARCKKFTSKRYHLLTLGTGLPIERPSGDNPFREPVAQLVERLTFNEDVHGSNPCGLTIFPKFSDLMSV